MDPPPRPFGGLQKAQPGTFEDFIEFIVPELQHRSRYWDDYDESTRVRERLYGVGQKHIRDDHAAARFRVGAKATVG